MNEDERARRDTIQETKFLVADAAVSRTIGAWFDNPGDSLVELKIAIMATLKPFFIEE